ncbi:hypothetical protein Fmac_031602 [Flemingia macrophylla]|uniref:Glycoside hydrolase family 3 N-terminal domain-containing protein n=1 Tax=Flemingia macrophylla TaxID=520843 RepID=A0ABD1L2J8_9FABA
MPKACIFLVGLLLLQCWVAMAEAENLKYKDPKQPLNVRIKDFMDRMTLEEKIGQMVQIDRSVASAEVMNKYYIGSVLSGGGSVPKLKASGEDWIHMVNDFQKGALSTRLGIPMIYGIDVVHGHNNVYNATIFPHNIGLGATKDPKLARKIGEATALEVRATGIQYAFAPCIAASSSAVLANSKVLDHFVGMGFSREMVSKVIQEYGEENEAKLLEELLTYTDIEKNISDSENDDTLRTLVKMGYKQEEALISIERLGGLRIDILFVVSFRYFIFAVSTSFCNTTEMHSG